MRLSLNLYFALAGIVCLIHGKIAEGITFNDLYTMSQPTGFVPDLGIKSGSVTQTIGDVTVGGGYPDQPSSLHGQFHALLWTAAQPSGVDLTPAGASISFANATDGIHVVGKATGTITGGSQHAFLWNVSDGTFMDLNPSGHTKSEAVGLNGTQYVGEVDNHARFGTAQVVHLLIYIPPADLPVPSQMRPTASIRLVPAPLHRVTSTHFSGTAALTRS